MAHQELGRDLLKRVEADLQEYGKVDHFPKMEGRQMVMQIAPLKRSNASPSKTTLLIAGTALDHLMAQVGKESKVSLSK